MSEPKPGWKTTEFYASVAAMLVPQIVEGLPATWRAALTAGAAALYTLARGLAKLGIGAK